MKRRQSRWRDWVARPEGWLVALTAAVFVRAYKLGHLVPRRSPDASSYEWPWELLTLADMLQSLRTFGYPIVLRLWNAFADSYLALPSFHLLLYCLAVGFFWHSLAGYSRSPWMAFAAAVPLLTSKLVPFGRFVQPELIAPAMAIVSAALLFRLVGRPKSLALWIGLCLATLATYHLRPIYLAIAALLPLLGLCARWFIAQGDRRQLIRFGAGLVLATLVPVFVYCGFRWIAVGHFGVINLLGYELVGITANFLDDETVAALPEDYRELGERTLRQRKLRKWTTYTETSNSLPHFRQYGQNQWYIAEPFARQIVMRHRNGYRRVHGVDALPVSPLEAWQMENQERPPLEGDLARAINDYFEGFGKTLLRQKPELYRKWVRDAFTYGLGRVTKDRWVRWPLLALAASVPFLLGARRWRRESSDRTRAVAGVWAMSILGVGFFLGDLLLMSIVSWPWDRYLYGAALFLPPALTTALFCLWSEVLGGRRKPTSTPDSRAA